MIAFCLWVLVLLPLREGIVCAQVDDALNQLLDSWSTKSPVEVRQLLNPTTLSLINLLFTSKINAARAKSAQFGNILSSIDTLYLDSDVALDAFKTAM